MTLEWWVPVFAPCLVYVLTYWCGISLSCLGGKIDNMRKLNENFGLLESALDELITESDKVQSKVNAGELKGGKWEAEVNKWLLKVGTIETDTNLLLGHQAPAQDDAVVDQELSTPGCWSTDSISNCCLGEKVFKKLKEVRDLTCRAQFYLEIKQAPPVVEQRDVQDTCGLDMTLEKTWQTVLKNRIVGIYGMGGVGKTTLLALVNNKFATAEKVEGKYDVVIWVKVSKDVDVGNIQDDDKKIQVRIEEIQDTIGERLHLCDENWSTYKKAKKSSELRKALKEKPKFVLLLDDLWKDVSLSEIGLPANGEYKIVFTTRSEDVCARMEANEKIKVEFLANTHAWDLFKLKASCDRSNEEVSDIAKKIAAKCCGLPLALVVIGKAMSSKNTVDQWRRAFNKVESSPSKLKGTEDIFQVLKLSFDQLEENEAKCFQYCALFPKAHNIKRDELVEYWIGEGIIDEERGRKTAVDRGDDIIDTLVEACLLLKDGESELKVYMHDMIREMALSSIVSSSDNGERYVVQAGDGLSHFPDANDWKTVTKMSVMNNEIGDIPYDHDFPDRAPLITLFLQNNKLVDIVGRFFEVLSSLVVLDLSRNPNITELPKEISMLVALRYLSLLGTMIKELPEGFGKLTQLIHLDLESTSELQCSSLSMISGFSKLQVLRFYDSKASLDASLMEHLKRMRRLHVLTITVSDVDVLETFLGSRLAGKTLALHLQGVKVSVASFAATFGELESLRRLKMSNCDIIESDTEWKDNCTPSTSSNQITPSITWFKDLSAVVLFFCEDVRDLTWLTYANNLESLSISFSRNLEEVISQKKAGNVQAEPFQKLQVLDLGYLNELRSIYWRPLSSPGLREVTITKCPKLPLNSIWVKNIDLLMKRS